MSIRKHHRNWLIRVQRTIGKKVYKLSGSTQTYEAAENMEARFIKELESMQTPQISSPVPAKALNTWGYA